MNLNTANQPLADIKTEITKKNISYIMKNMILVKINYHYHCFYVYL